MPRRINSIRWSVLDWLPVATIGQPLLQTALVFLLLFAHLGVVAADSAVSQEALAKRWQAIQQLNESQRQELVRKYESYRELGEAERNQLRSLHKDLEADSELKDVMQKYCDWLKNLDVTQREQLRQAKTPEQKRNLVERFLKDQSQKKEETWRDNPMPERERRLIPPMSTDDLKSVMTAIEEAYTKNGVISKEQQSELEKRSGSQRYKLLMQSLAAYRQPKEGPARHLEIPESVVIALENVVKNPEFRQKLRGSVRNADQRHIAQKIVFMGLLASTIDQAQREFYGSEKAELKDSLFQSLAPDAQARVSQLPPWKLDLELIQIHREELFRAFSRVGDFPMGFGDRGQPGRGFPPFPQKRETPREGGPRDGARPPLQPDARRPMRDRPKNEADKRD